MVLVASGSYLVCWSDAFLLPQSKATTRSSFRTTQTHSLSRGQRYSSALNLFNMGKKQNKESNDQRYDDNRSSPPPPSRGVLHPKTGDFVVFIGYDNNSDNRPTPKVGKLVQIYDTPPTSNQRRHRGDDWSCTVEELAEVKPGFYAQLRSSQVLPLNLEDVAPIADATYDVREQCYRIPIDSRTGLPKTYQDQYDLDSYQGPMMMMPGGGYSYQPQRDASVENSSNSNRYDPFAPNSGWRGANYQDYRPDGTLEKNNFYQPMAIEKAMDPERRKANAVRWDPTWSQDKRVNENAPTRNVPYNPQAPTSVSDVMRKDLDYRGRRRDEPDYSYTRRQSDFSPSQNLRQPEYSYQQQQRPTYRYNPAFGPNGINNRNPNARTRAENVNPNYNGMDLSPPPPSRFSDYKQQREQQQGRRGSRYGDRRTYSADRRGTRQNTVGESYGMNRGPNYGGRSRDDYSSQNRNRLGSFAQYRQSQRRQSSSPPQRDDRYGRGSSSNSNSRSNFFPSPASSRSYNNNRYRNNQQRGGTVSLQSNDPNRGYYSRGYYSDRQEPSRATLPMQQPQSRATLPMQQSGFMGNTRMGSYNGNNGYGYDDREQVFGDRNSYDGYFYSDSNNRRRRYEQNKLVDPARPPSQPGRIMYNRARENAANWAQVPRNFRVIPTGVGGRPR